MYTKLRCLRCFKSGLFTKQVINILKEVVPFCKSGHICTLPSIQPDTQVNMGKCFLIKTS